MDGLLGRIPARLFAEWQAYYKLEPFGAERDNWHMATLGKLTFDLSVRPDDRDRLELSDLMYHEPVVVEPRPAVELYAEFRALALGLGARKA